MGELLPAVAIFLATAATIVVAGTFLTRFTDRLAELTGLGRTLAGMLLLAAATSLPELSVDISLAWQGSLDLAVGTLLGSNLMNLLLLALLDLTPWSRGRMLSRVAVAHTLAAAASLLLMGLVLLFLLSPIEWTVFTQIDPGAMIILGAYLYLVRLIYKDQNHAQAMAMHEPPAVETTAPPEAEFPTGDGLGLTQPPEYSLLTSVLGYLGSALVILLAAPWLAESAETIAKVTELGETFIGTTLVALSTSLPELITSLAAIRMRAFDLAVGNVFGSNAFNMLIVVAVDLFQQPPGPLFSQLTATSTSLAISPHAVTATWGILVTGMAMAAMNYRPQKRYYLVEPGGATLIILVLVALYMVYQFR